eukprot:TRINITY_DN122235_c0_g1_i1.p1 TRINITY_DN122235_c0_g1~~TRINITY_DN122235_c0_g1_i1.p1  ORF type:complete len:468 (-),score=54.47 TRINITY_DN122235_c0_g1_i1:51-1454(-)
MNAMWATAPSFRLPLLLLSTHLCQGRAAEVDESCVLFEGLCDDTTHLLRRRRHSDVAAQKAQLPGSDNDLLSEAAQAHLRDMDSRGAQFFCYSTGVAGENFLVLDPGAVNTSTVVNRQLPTSIQDLQAAWFHSSFQYANAKTASHTWHGKTWGQAPLTGFRVDTEGAAFMNDGGGFYGNGYGGPPPNCWGEQEEVVTCLSSAHALRQADVSRGAKCTSKAILSPNASSNSSDCELLRSPDGYIVRNRNAWALGTMDNPPVVHPESMDPAVAHGTNKYFYLPTVAGKPCADMNSASNYLELLRRFVRAFQGMIDIWKLKPACDGKCVITTGALSAWYSYSGPTSVSLLIQLRAWASVKIDGLAGCEGGQAVLKFGSMSITDDGIVCCPQPMSGGACQQSFALPSGWATKIAEGSDNDFAQWMVSVYPGCDSKFPVDDKRCVYHDYAQYIPLAAGASSPEASPVFSFVV